MTTSMEQEKQRISERLARLDAEREKLGTQLDELEIAERVLARFGWKASTTEKRRRLPPAKSTPAAGEERKARGSQQALGMSLSDATFKAVQAHGDGATASEVSLSLTRISDGGPAESPRYDAAASPPCRPARKPQSTLVCAALGLA